LGGRALYFYVLKPSLFVQENAVPKTDAEWMRLAIEKSREGVANGQTPFGAVITKNGELVIAAHNVVWATTDITAHAEVNAIRLACKKLNAIDLRGCTIYSSTEPCPMCFSAIHWAGMEKIFYGASIADAAAAGFNELPISNHDMKRLGQSRVEVVADLLREEAQEVFRQFVASVGKKIY
jgi:tRNA(Arg) A34 adenosine deaminase TadA